MKFWILIVLFLVPTLIVSQEDDPKVRREKILQFGLESDVITLIRDLRDSKISEHNTQLQEIFSSTSNFKLKEEILRFFQDTMDFSLTSSVRSLMMDTQAPLQLRLSSISYLSSLEDQDSIANFEKLLEDTQRSLVIASVRALGRLKAEASGHVIFDYMNREDFDEDYLVDFVWTIGEIAYQDAQNFLMNKYSEYNERPLIQSEILMALGKIKNPESLETLVSALNHSNVKIRESALQGIVFFDIEESKKALITGARDSQASIRLIAIEGIEKKGLLEALDLLAFRAESDPDSGVRIAALKAIKKLSRNLYNDVAKKVLTQRALDVKIWSHLFEDVFAESNSVLETAVSDRLQKELSTLYSPYALASAQTISKEKNTAYKKWLDILSTSKDQKVLSMLLRTIKINEQQKEKEAIQELLDATKGSKEFRDSLFSVQKRLTTTE